MRAAVPDGLVGALRQVPGLTELWSNASRPGVRPPPRITEADRAWLDRSLQAHVQFYEERT